jgi:DNA invertase Pin-like site-specific DNA recombinase
MKLVAYIRVSRKDQLSMYGPERQREEIVKFARRNRHRLVAEILEDVSGTVPTSGRDGWRQAVAMTCSGQAEGIVILDLSRLSRDLIEQETALREVDRCEARLFSCSGEEQRVIEDPTEPQRKLIRHIVGAVNEHDRDQIVARMQAGRRIKKAAGGYAGGQPPFGWRGADASKELVPHDGEQVVLRRMGELAAAGVATRAAAEVLNSEGLRTRRVGLWSSPMVARYLRTGVLGVPGVTRRLSK